ncbi:MAG TPA: imidazole glycerol phosphate synthase subunit HisH [Vicinamibacterales bacterium]|nr:imidazole glycerol phosphate synthase subunit HisH [Vicinamibacterales bacterium]
MLPRIALIDYKAGNLTSVRKALAAVGADVYTPDAARELDDAQGVIVPGVGHFAATAALDQAWVDAILARLGEGRPLLGICLGLQWLYEGSDESPELRGLGLLSGTCHKLPGDSTEGQVIKVPHVGWNSLERLIAAPIMEGVADNAQVYFTHSYVAPVTVDSAAATTHGERFASVVQRGQVAGDQVHPEKSGEVGLQILRNYMKMVG